MDNTFRSAGESQVWFLQVFWESHSQPCTCSTHLSAFFTYFYPYNGKDETLDIFVCLDILGKATKGKNDCPSLWAVLTTESLFILRCLFKMWVHIFCRTEMRSSESISFLSDEYISTTATSSEMQMHSESPKELWEMPTYISIRHLLRQKPGVASRNTSLVQNDSDYTFQWCI